MFPKSSTCFLPAFVVGGRLFSGPDFLPKETCIAEFRFEFQKSARDTGLFLSHKAR